MRRRDLVAGLTAAPFAAWAQPSPTPPLVGFLHPGFPSFTGPSASYGQLEDGLRGLGYVNGQNLKLEARWGNGKTETLSGLAQELVRLKVDVLVAIARPSIEAAKIATSELPIVGLDLESDPVASGFVASWAAPGGNVTGLFLDLPSLTAKWLQMIREVVPEARQVAVLWDSTTGDSQLRSISAAAKTMGIELQVLEFRDTPTMERVLDAGLGERPQALVQLGSVLINQSGRRIAEIVAKYGVPAISQFRSFSEGGGIMSYGPVLSAWFRELAPYVTAILKGAKPAALPVRQPTNFEFVVNMKAAAILGITIPPTILLRADEVIE